MPCLRPVTFHENHFAARTIVVSLIFIISGCSSDHERTPGLHQLLRSYAAQYPAALQKFHERVAQAAYPAVHHSPAYLEAYKPAYRVLLLDEARWLLETTIPKNPF